MSEWISEGEAGLRKWFGDHWKHAVSEEVAAELDREHALRMQAAEDAARAAASDMRAQADTVDPDVAPVPAAVAPEAPVEAPAAEAPGETGAAPAADASEATETTTEGA